jgi:hypothetical protein
MRVRRFRRVPALTPRIIYFEGREKREETDIFKCFLFFSLFLSPLRENPSSTKEKNVVDKRTNLTKDLIARLRF